MTLEQAFLHRLGRILWRSLVFAVVLLAAYVSLGRLLVDAVGEYRQPILDELNRRVPFTIEAEHVSGEWRAFSPELVLSGLELRLQREPPVAIALGEGRVRLNVLGSLLDMGLRVSRLQLTDLDLPLVLEPDGRVHLEGFSGGDSELGQWAQNLLLTIEQLRLSDNQLSVRLPAGGRRELALDLTLQRDGSQRQLRGDLLALATGTRIELRAETLGNPFELDTVEGDAFLRATGADLSALADWLPPQAPNAPALLAGGAHRDTAATGNLDLKLWLAWRRGEPLLEGRVSGRDLQLTAPDGGWVFPLDRLDFAATLRREDNSWTVFGRDLSLTQGEIALTVPHLQLDLWGDSLRLRGEQVPLGPVSALYAAFPATHPKLAEALDTLDASARLGRVEFNLDDIHAPGRGWQVAANFSELQVQSWRGAPGIKNAAGFVSLSPGEGRVILDSRQLSMNFPTVYDHSLDYEDLYGTLDVNWGSEFLVLRSGLITAHAEEGRSRALFGLRVPFEKTPAGIEMDLMVGLRDASVDQRGKYLPAVLDKRLLGWLRDSPGGGVINQGAFLWRGSLRWGAAPLRTVQLFFDVAEANLSYHPDWPPLSELEGLVMIDDADVSVWAERARMYDSELRRLSAEAWQNGDRHMRLAITGEMEGRAADGLQLVRESPLAEVTGHAFDEWSLQGDLRTSLAMELDLGSNQPPPRVAVTAMLENAQLDIAPLDLAVDELSGEVDYHSASGFSSRNLAGRLWGQPVTATLSREPGALTEAGEPDPNALRMDLQGQVPAEPLQAWLGLPAPGPVSGTAGVTARLRAIPGQRPTLHLASSLEGVALALPSPLGKAVGEAIPATLDLDLAGDIRRLDLDLERRLQLALLLGDGRTLLGGEAALQDVAPPPRPGRLGLSGQMPRLDTREWRDTLGELGLAAMPGPGSGPEWVVDDLLVEALSLDGLEIDDVMLSARGEPGANWTFDAETDWLGGELRLLPGMERGTLNLRHLELRGLSRLGGQRDSDTRGRLPDLQVDIDSMTRDGRALGELHFQLESTPWAIRAAAITGEIAGLKLTPEAPAELLWQRSGAGRSNLFARLDFQDFGTVLGKLGYEQVLETDSGHFDLQLEWPGGPQDFALVEAEGRMGIDVDSGRFLDAPAGASGTLRVVSILNLTEIIRRLSLSHMFESGIPFDDVDGELFFHRGTIEVPSVAVRGAASSFTFSGASTLEQRTLNGELVATLPVASNLPWVAALTAGLPVAAGVFVVSKVFEHQMNRMTSAVYGVEGSWDDPDVKFRRIFDTGEKSGPDNPPAVHVDDLAGDPVTGAGTEQQ